MTARSSSSTESGRAVATLRAATRAEAVADYLFWEADAQEARCSRRVASIFRDIAKLRCDLAATVAPSSLIMLDRLCGALHLHAVQAESRLEAARLSTDLRRAEADVADRRLQAAIALVSAHPSYLERSPKEKRGGLRPPPPRVDATDSSSREDGAIEEGAP